MIGRKERTDPEEKLKGRNSSISLFNRPLNIQLFSHSVYKSDDDDDEARAVNVEGASAFGFRHWRLLATSRSSCLPTSNSAGTTTFPICHHFHLTYSTRLLHTADLIMASKRKLSDSDVSAVPPSNPSATVHPVYQKLLAKASDGIAFLYCSRLSDSLKTPASQVAAMYNVTVDQALEEYAYPFLQIFCLGCPQTCCSRMSEYS